jgi:periplasmic protein TonB
MNSQQQFLHLQIKDHRGLFQRTLRPGEKMTIGHAPENDIVVFREEYPKTHPLLENKGERCRLYIHSKMSGVVSYQDSDLGFHDLILQELLPRHGDFYVLTLLPGRKGVVHIGEAQVAFVFNSSMKEGDSLLPYSWRAAIRRTLKQDLFFKISLMVMLVLELFFVARVNRLDFPPLEAPKIENIPQRFARFILPSRPQPAAVPVSGAGSVENQADKESTGERPQSGSSSAGSVDERAVRSAGLLGLIGGSGTSGKASATVDFLLDQGLVKQLDDLIGSTTTVLQGRTTTGSGTGSRGGSGTDGTLDDLVAFSTAGGVDDLIAGSGVKSVEMQKQGSVNIQAPETIRGSEQARGQRTAESVMSIINAQRGRVMYTYNKYLRQNPELSGKVSLDVTIAAEGRVADVQVVESTIENPDFIRDLISILKSLRFPAITEGNVTVNVPFVFNRAM